MTATDKAEKHFVASATHAILAQAPHLKFDPRALREECRLYVERYRDNLMEEFHDVITKAAVHDCTMCGGTGHVPFVVGAPGARQGVVVGTYNGNPNECRCGDVVPVNPAGGNRNEWIWNPHRRFGLFDLEKPVGFRLTPEVAVPFRPDRAVLLLCNEYENVPVVLGNILEDADITLEELHDTAGDAPAGAAPDRAPAPADCSGR